MYGIGLVRRDEKRVQAKPLALQLALSGMEKRLSLVYYVNRLEQRGYCGRPRRIAAGLQIDILCAFYSCIYIEKEND